MRRRRRVALASLYLLFFALLAAFALASPQGWMPGPLSREHQFTGDRCDSCHSPGGDVASKCGNCHENSTLAKGWREHRRDEFHLTNGSSVAGGLLSRSVGGSGIVGLSVAGAAIVFALALAWDRLVGRSLPKRRSGRRARGLSAGSSCGRPKS